MNNTLHAWYRHEHGPQPLVLRADEDVDRVIDEMRTLHNWDYSVLNLVCPTLPLRPSGLPNHQLLAAVHYEQPIGALFYFGEDVEQAMFSAGANLSGEKQAVYGYMGHERFFPVDSELELSQVRAAVKEFLATTRQPSCVQWQVYDFDALASR